MPLTPQPKTFFVVNVKDIDALINEVYTPLGQEEVQGTKFIKGQVIRGGYVSQDESGKILGTYVADIRREMGYSCVKANEWLGEMYSFTVTGEHAVDVFGEVIHYPGVHEHEAELIQRWGEGHVPSIYGEAPELDAILDDLCANGHLPPGNYLIDIRQ